MKVARARGRLRAEQFKLSARQEGPTSNFQGAIQRAG
jgi:hypothetical protein